MDIFRMLRVPNIILEEELQKTSLVITAEN